MVVLHELGFTIFQLRMIFVFIRAVCKADPSGNGENASARHRIQHADVPVTVIQELNVFPAPILSGQLKINRPD
jgi:hypothetical protein